MDGGRGGDGEGVEGECSGEVGRGDEEKGGVGGEDL